MFASAREWPDHQTRSCGPRQGIANGAYRERGALLRRASVSVRAVEKQMFSPLSDEQQHHVRQILTACVTTTDRNADAS